MSAGSYGITSTSVVATPQQLTAHVASLLTAGHRGFTYQPGGFYVERYVRGREFTALVVGSARRPNALRVYPPIERAFDDCVPPAQRFCYYELYYESKLVGEAGALQDAPAPCVRCEAPDLTAPDATCDVGSHTYTSIKTFSWGFRLLVGFFQQAPCIKRGDGGGTTGSSSEKPHITCLSRAVGARREGPGRRPEAALLKGSCEAGRHGLTATASALLCFPGLRRPRATSHTPPSQKHDADVPLALPLLSSSCLLRGWNVRSYVVVKDPDLLPAIVEAAKAAYIAAGGCGYGRVDMRLDEDHDCPSSGPAATGGGGEEGAAVAAAGSGSSPAAALARQQRLPPPPPRLVVLEVNANCGVSNDGETSVGLVLRETGLRFADVITDILCEALLEARSRWPQQEQEQEGEGAAQAAEQ